MTIEKLQKIAAAILSGDINCVTKDNAVSPEFIGLRFFDSPVFGAANSDDPQFEMLREPGVVDQESLLPRDILPASKSVISWFLPFTAKVRNYNREDMFSPSDAWLQARIEGQEANFAIGEAICRQLETEGYCAIQPSCSNKFKNLTLYCSNWSERHVAYIAGPWYIRFIKGSDY